MSQVDLELGAAAATTTTINRRSLTGSDVSVAIGDDNNLSPLSESDIEEGSCYSQFYSTRGGSYDEHSFACAVAPEIDDACNDSRRDSSASDFSIEVDGENGGLESKVNLDKVERDCRICHLGLESNSHESGLPIELGCSCKDDLSVAHKQCAEAWFKIKGNKTCEICHSVARNVTITIENETVEQVSESNNAQISTLSASIPHAETRSFWQGHRFLNFLLACMVFAFVISWLFHFNVPS